MKDHSLTHIDDGSLAFDTDFEMVLLDHNIEVLCLHTGWDGNGDTNLAQGLGPAVVRVVGPATRIRLCVSGRRRRMLRGFKRQVFVIQIIIEVMVMYK